MIKIRLERLYNKPYYLITQDEKTAHAYGFEQVKDILEKIRTPDEEVELDDSVLKEHSELIKLLEGGKNEKNKNTK